MKTLIRRKIKTSLLLSLIVASTCSGSSLAQDAATVPPTERMTYRDNYVYLVIKTDDYKLQGGSYVTSDRSITSGQDPDGKNDPPNTYYVRAHDGAIGFSVGRKGSTQVADWFSSKLRPNNNTFNSHPDKLNFAFVGNLSLSIAGPGLKPNVPVNFPDIYLAQGHSGSTNNWWFGGPGCTTAFGPMTDQVTCRSSNYPSMTFTFLRGNNGGILHNAPDEVLVYIKQ